MTRTWSIMDLVLNHQTGRLRESALWANLFKLTVLVEYILHVSATNFETLTGVTGVLLVGHEVIKAKQNQDQQKLDKDATKPAA